VNEQAAAAAIDEFEAEWGKKYPSYNRQLRKVTKGKSILPNDELLIKMLYLSTWMS